MKLNKRFLNKNYVIFVKHPAQMLWFDNRAGFVGTILMDI